MQNSIWKLTALAGVIGIGFLIILQAQQGIDRERNPDQAISQTAAETGVAPEAAPVEPASRWKSSPQELSASTPGQSRLLNNDPASALFSSEPAEPATLEPGLFSSTQSEPEVDVETAMPEPRDASPLFTSNSDDPFQSRLVPPPTSPEPLILTGSSEIPTANNSAAPDFGSQEPGTIPELDPDGETPRERALRLMAEARRFMDENDLTFARVKAVTAADQPVRWRAGEETPADLIAEIDRLMQPEPAEPVVTLEPDALPLPAELLAQPAEPAAPAELTAPSDSEAPLLNIDLSDNPFGSSEPEPEALLPEPTRLTSDPVVSIPAVKPVVAPSSPKTIETRSTASVVEAAPGSAAPPASGPGNTQRPELTIEKIAPPEATLGKSMIYSIVIANRGSTSASQVVVEDQVPKGTKLVGTIPQAELIGTRLLWRLGAMPAGDEKKILVKVVPIEEGPVGSVATVSFVSEVSSRTEVVSPRQVVLKVQVIGPEQVQVGEPVLFKFKIANEGTKDATEVVLQDVMTIGFGHPDGRDLTNPIGNIPAGESFEAELELMALEPGRQTNRVIVTAADGLRAEALANVEVIESRGLKVNVVNAPPKPVGQKVTQMIRVANESTKPLQNATVTLVLHEAVNFTAASPGAQYDRESRVVRWPLRNVQPGEELVLEASLIPTSPGVHANLVQLEQTNQEKQQIDAKVEARGIATLRLELDSIPPSVTPGEEFAVQVTVLNKGTGPDSNVSIALVLPPELEFIRSVGPVKPLPPQVTSSGRRTTFQTIPEIGEKASVDFQVTLRARSAGKPKLRAEVKSDQLADTVATEAAIVSLAAE